MIARSITVICVMGLAACAGPTAPPAGIAPVADLAPIVVGPNAADGGAVPLAVITNLPQGVSATNVAEDASGCFTYATVDANLPVTDNSGNQICRG